MKVTTRQEIIDGVKGEIRLIIEIKKPNPQESLYMGQPLGTFNFSKAEGQELFEKLGKALTPPLEETKI